MIHNKSIRILKTFSKEELKQFSDFVRSPFHNKNKNLIKLFDILRKYHPEYEFEKEKLYSKIYQGKEYNHNNMKKLMSEMFLISEKFLLQLIIKKETFTVDKYILEEYMNRKLNELFLHKLKKINEKSEKTKYCTDVYFYDKLYVENLTVVFYDLNNMREKTSMDSLIKRSEYILGFFLENVSIELSDISVFRGVGVNKFKEDLISESFLKSLDVRKILKYLSLTKTRTNFILFKFNSILMFIYPENETYFKQAKHFLFSKNNNVFIENSKAFRENSVFLENYCSKMYYKGIRKFRHELHEISQQSVKLLLENSDKNNIKIDSVFYLNLVGVSTGIGELKWVEEFIKDYTKYLPEKDRESSYNFAKAVLAFAKRNYEEALSYASKLPRTTYYYKMEVRIFILKCYFELSLFDEAFSLIDSSKHYLAKTDELDSDGKKHFKVMLSTMCKLFKLKNNTNIVKSDLLSLKSEIINNRLNPDWYLQKIEELEKSISVKGLHGKLNKKRQSKKLLKTS
ncbi:MAG: hypothetical protein M3R36_14635 [Bacteroidota bacterium]|nr:hypothetical protein [Bacteroidota bacterium]